MKNIFLNGKNNNPENIEKMLKILNIDEIINYGYYGYVLDNETDKKFESITEGDTVNLICDAEGCNYGVYFSTVYKQKVKNLVLMSPTFFKANFLERIHTTLTRNGCSEYSKEIKTRKSLFKTDFKEIEKFSSSAELARIILPGKKGDVRSLIMYGNGDASISRRALEAISRSYDSEIKDYPTTCHNLLLSAYSTEVANDIKKFIKQ